ncbi:hypothetical protein V1512DRAFT_246994 [Lipomyces arxii]|uniref:uncharacterized protein n=1 Tax=Lipomyces arxii TaxID=56418 RepID=UPI0034CE4CAD
MTAESVYEAEVLELQIYTDEKLRVVYSTSSFEPDSLRSLLILDSSFNPPTFAHLGLINSAIKLNSTAEVLLLLAIQNADKPVMPAMMKQRLSMMEKFSHDVPARVMNAITTCPRFVDKANAVASRFGEVEQIYVVGYDTLIRLLDHKYYPGQALEQALGGFMAMCKIVCFIRDSSQYGTAENQTMYVERIRQGRIDGVPSAWADRISLMSYADHGLSTVSSTAVRQACRTNEPLHDMVPNGVAEYIRTNKLYK